MPKLLIVAGDGTRREVELTTRLLRLGRAPENDIALPDPTKGVSRVHAELRYENGRYVIVDLNSQNGTWVDETRIERSDLATGSEIAIGPYRLALIGDGVAEPVGGQHFSNGAGAPPPARSDADASSRVAAPREDARHPSAAAALGTPAWPQAPPIQSSGASQVAEAVPVVDAQYSAPAVEKPAEVDLPPSLEEPVAAEAPSSPEKVVSAQYSAPPVDEPLVVDVPPSVETPAAAVAPPSIEKPAEAPVPQPLEKPAAAAAKPLVDKAAAPAAPPSVKKPAAPAASPSAQKPAAATVRPPIGKMAAAPTSDKASVAGAPPSEEKSAAAAAPPKIAPRPRPPRPMPPPPRAASGSNAGLVVLLLVIALLLIAAGWYFYWPKSSAPRPTSSGSTPATDPNQIASVAQIIARDLVDGKALIEKKEYEAAIRDHFDRILLLDPKHTEAIALKAKAQQALEAQQAEAASAAAAASASKPAAKPAAPTGGTTTARGTTPPGAAARGAQALPSPRRPNETEQTWRTRNAALQTQYDGAKTAFDRRQYAAAVSGFDAIVKAEPKYRDAAQLLAKARAEQNVTGRDALDAGNKLDAAGRWAQALEQYDRARQLDASLRTQVDDARARVLTKMRGAGGDAFKRARQYDALGRSADALKEYENAAQWLPPDDANRAVARQRADQLKAGGK